MSYISFDKFLSKVNPLDSIMDKENQQKKKKKQEADSQPVSDIDEKVSELLEESDLLQTMAHLAKFLQKKGVDFDWEELHEMAQDISSQKFKTIAKKIINK